MTFVGIEDGALVLREALEPGAGWVPVHRHGRQIERFAVLSGALAIEARGARRTLGPGETATVPVGVPHRYANGGPGPLLIEVRLAPALDAHRFFESVYGLMREGGLPPRSVGDALALMALCHEHGFHSGPAPSWLLRPVAAFGAGLTRLAGRSSWRPGFAAEAECRHGAALASTDDDLPRPSALQAPLITPPATAGALAKEPHP